MMPQRNFLKIELSKEDKKAFQKFSRNNESIRLDEILGAFQFFSPLSANQVLKAIRNNKEGNLIATEIWPSSYCNHKCLFCVSLNCSLLTNKNLDKNILMSTLKDLASVGNKVIRISGGGEPFLNTAMRGVIEKIRELGMKGFYITNGSLLDDDYIDKLVHNASIVRISFNSGERRNYELIHGVDHFKKVIKVMEMLARKRLQSKNEDRLALGVTFVATQNNIKTLKKSSTIVKDCGFDYILIRGINRLYNKIDRKQKHTLIKFLSDVEKLSDKRFFISGYRINSKECKNSSHNKRCYISSCRMFIDSEGYVYPCFNAILKGYKRIGNIYNTPINIVWPNKYRAFTEKIKNGISKKFCSDRCGYTELNKYLEFIL